ncbi:DUF2802 domain-containing protein [Uliginosibacterium sp. 31-16]|uniref:DUF2802 domain-containing protein n=1 Tax=Uliginosibacterium sp. 31-16 TaxID=3068315 RepID=UPI00273E1BE6|nr:DUF2802 domain-containing protein [Uliginosibacterium sp. 31-16]MDP5241066.1 DUF2802 domain-containing protein [Uliginosibacterium sp. 31-16]
MTPHDIVYGLVGLLLAYIAWLLLRYFATPSRRPEKADPLEFSDTSSETIHSQILGGLPGKSFSSVFYDGTPPAMAAEVDERPEPKLMRPVEPDASAFGFDALLEMRQTRVLLDELRADHDALQAELADLKEQISDLRAAAQVSPLYGEAMALARRGYDVQAIAERCDISVAEAELVRSLSGDSADGETKHAGS